MDNHRIKRYITLLGILTLCALCFIIGRWGECRKEITTEIKWDTLRIEAPVPYEIEKVRTEYIYVPTPADTVVVEVADTVVKEVVQIDSVLVAVDIERRVYQDSLYRAVVSGAVVGDVHPSLDHIDIYSRSETRVIERTPPMFRPYIRGSIGKEMMGLGGGVSIKDRVDIDAQYVRIYDKDMVVFGVNWRFNIKDK